MTLKLKRFRLFEFCDQPWFTGMFRETFHEMLSFNEAIFGSYKGAPIIIREWQEKTGAQNVLDLCSGNGMALTQILTSAKKKNIDLPAFILSDLFPHVEEYQALQESFGADKLSFVKESVSALNPPTYSSYDACIIITALHHFEPKQVQDMIQNILANKKSLLILEPFDRTFSMLIFFLFMFPSVIPIGLLHFFINIFRRNFLKAFVACPLVSLAVFFDGVVSILRVYRPEEIMRMLPEGENFKIFYGRLNTYLPIKATYCYIWKETL